MKRLSYATNDMTRSNVDSRTNISTFTGCGDAPEMFCMFS